MVLTLQLASKMPRKRHNWFVESLSPRLRRMNGKVRPGKSAQEEENEVARQNGDAQYPYAKEATQRKWPTSRNDDS
jgi:hypothetical protein